MDTNDLIKKAVFLVNEDTKYYKKVLSNTTVPAPEWTMWLFEVKDPTGKAAKLITVPTQKTAEDFTILLVAKGWEVKKARAFKPSTTNVADLYEHVPDDAVTEKTIPIAPGSKEMAFVITVNWETNGEKKEKILLTKFTNMSPANVNKLVKSKLIDPLSGNTDIQNPTFVAVPSTDSMREGTIDLLTVSPEVLQMQSSTKTPVSYKIKYRDYEGDEFEIITVKSNTPIDEYIKKLKMSGFTNITYDVSKAPGKIKLEDINSDTKPAPQKKGGAWDKIKRWLSENDIYGE